METVLVLMSEKCLITYLRDNICVGKMIPDSRFNVILNNILMCVFKKISSMHYYHDNSLTKEKSFDIIILKSTFKDIF